MRQRRWLCSTHIISTAVRTVDNAVVDNEENESRETLKIHTVSLTRFMGKGTAGWQKM
jgi:hypothetical protein